MKTPPALHPMPRREFVKSGVALGAVAATGPLAALAPLRAAPPPAPRQTIGIQIGAVSFVDEGTEPVLDLLQERGAEAGLDELATAGLSADYVFRETQRALAGVAGRCRVLPGIDIGIPTGRNSRKASPDDTSAAVAAALKAGADGVILSRKYSEMRLANLAAAGRAARDAAKGQV